MKDLTETQEIYRIIDRSTGRAIGSYTRSYRDEYDFSTPGDARASNFSGEFENKEKYRIAKYRVIYELIEEDVQG